MMSQMVKKKNLPATRETRVWSLGLGRSLGERNGLPMPVFLPGEFHGQRSLVGYSPWSHKESDTIERLTLSLHSMSQVFYIAPDVMIFMKKTLNKCLPRTSFQWLRFCLPMQGLWVHSLVPCTTTREAHIPQQKSLCTATMTQSSQINKINIFKQKLARMNGQ